MDIDDEIAPLFRNRVKITDKITNYKLYKDRLRSFIDKESGYFIPARKMAKAGFYFLGPNSRVRCAFCGHTMDGWYHDRNALGEVHKRLVPNCEYFTKYDEIHIEDRIFFFLQSVGVQPDFEMHPENRKFITIENRLKSFDKYKYKEKMVVDIRTVCEAGFFFEGARDKDRIKCFCCQLTFEDLLNDFDIWKFHAKSGGRCSFLLLNKSKEFVMDVHRGSYNIPEIEYEDFLKLMTYQQFAKTMYPLIINKPKKIQTIRDLEPRIRKGCGSSTGDTTVIPDGLLCKICLKEKMEVLSMPCGHIFSCIQCAVTVSECSVCRCSISILIRIHLDFNRKVERNSALKWACTSAAVRFEEDFSPVLCQVCQKLEIQIALVPCNHVYSCFECAIESKECLICNKKFRLLK